MKQFEFIAKLMKRGKLVRSQQIAFALHRGTNCEYVCFRAIIRIFLEEFVFVLPLSFTSLNCVLIKMKFYETYVVLGEFS